MFIFFEVHYSVSRTEQTARVMATLCDRPCVKTFWPTFLFWESLWFLITFFCWALKSSKLPFSPYLCLRHHTSFSCFANSIPCEFHPGDWRLYWSQQNRAEFLLKTSCRNWFTSGLSLAYYSLMTQHVPEADMDLHRQPLTEGPLRS